MTTKEHDPNTLAVHDCDCFHAVQSLDTKEVAHWMRKTVTEMEAAQTTLSHGFRSVIATCNINPAINPYWQRFYDRFEPGEEIPIERLKGFVAWLMHRHKGYITKKRHLRLVVDNGAPVVDDRLPDPEPPRLKRRRIKSAA